MKSHEKQKKSNLGNKQSYSLGSPSKQHARYVFGESNRARKASASSNVSPFVFKHPKTEQPKLAFTFKPPTSEQPKIEFRFNPPKTKQSKLEYGVKAPDMDQSKLKFVFKPPSKEQLKPAPFLSKEKKDDQRDESFSPNTSAEVYNTKPSIGRSIRGTSHGADQPNYSFKVDSKDELKLIATKDKHPKCLLSRTVSADDTVGTSNIAALDLFGANDPGANTSRTKPRPSAVSPPPGFEPITGMIKHSCDKTYGGSVEVSPNSNVDIVSSVFAENPNAKRCCFGKTKRHSPQIKHISCSDSQKQDMNDEKPMSDFNMTIVEGYENPFWSKHELDPTIFATRKRLKVFQQIVEA